MENLIMMKFTNFYLEANDLSNQHVYEVLKQRCFLHFFVYLILSQNILNFTRTFKHFIFLILSSNVT